jgi:antitoxin ParD1/3/4
MLYYVIAHAWRTAAMNISLTPELDEFINKKVESGFYATASEVVREALRLFRDQDDYWQRRKAQLNAEIQKGLDSLARGEVYAFDEAMKEDIKARGRARLAKETEHKDEQKREEAA